MTGISAAASLMGNALMAGAGQNSPDSVGKSKKKNRNKKKNEMDDYEWQDVPNQPLIHETQGKFIKVPDLPHVEPRDFLIAGRVAKRHTRPLTISEI